MDAQRSEIGTDLMDAIGRNLEGLFEVSNEASDASGENGSLILVLEDERAYRLTYNRILNT